MRAWTMAAWVCATSGCVQVSFTDREPFDVDAVTLAEVSLVRGDVSVGVAPGTEGTLSLTRWAWAGKESRAEDKAQEVDVGWGIEEGVLRVVSGRAPSQAGVDVGISVHPQTSLDLRTDSGDLLVGDVEGVWVLQGDRVSTTRLAGEGDVISNGGASLEIWPYSDGVITVDAGGDTVLALPAFGPYDLVVDGDPDYPMTIQDLGWDFVDQGLASFAGRRVPGTIRIDVVVRGGSFTLVESLAD